MLNHFQEEMESRVSPYAGRITPTYESDSEPEVEEQSSSSDGDETRAIGSFLFLYLPTNALKTS